MVGQRRDHPVVDGGRGMLLRDGEPVGRPFAADAVLHRCDHVEQDVLRCGAGFHRGEHGGRGGVLVMIDDRSPQTIAQHGEVDCRDGVGVPIGHAVYLPAVWPSTAVRWVRRGAVMATTAMSSWGSRPTHWEVSIMIRSTTASAGMPRHSASASDSR